MSFVIQQPPISSLPLASPFGAQHPVLTIDILRQTGLGLKLRVFFAMSCLALVPAVPLALVLIEGEKAVMFLSGRNALLCVLAIFVTIILVATWIALPIIRPIRRATRQIEFTTEEITALAQETLTIASDHGMGMTIIAGASTRLLGRRQSIIRDCHLIARECQIGQMHLTTLLQWLPVNPQTNLSQQALVQSIANIAQLADSVAQGIASDASLDKLQQAMKNAQDFSWHFQQASMHLRQEAEHMQLASRSLL